MNRKPEVGEIWTFAGAGGPSYLLLEEEVSHYFPNEEWSFITLRLSDGERDKAYFKKYARLYGGWRQVA